MRWIAMGIKTIGLYLALGHISVAGIDGVWAGSLLMIGAWWMLDFHRFRELKRYDSTKMAN